MQEAFFDFGETIPSELTGVGSRSGCQFCKLKEKCDHPQLEFKGEGQKRVLILFENPTYKESVSGNPFSDEQGEILREYLEDLNLDLDKDCWYGYAVSCHAPREKKGYPYPKISDNDLERCQEHLYNQINKIDPRVIIPMGTIAVKALLKFRVGGRLSGIKYHNYIGYSIPDQQWKININPTYSLDNIFATEDYRGYFDKVTVMRFKQHVQKAFKVAGTSFVERKWNQDVFIMFDKKEVIELLKKVKKEWKVVVFDYETSGLKPWKPGHKIYTVGISDGMFGFAFPYFHDSPRFRYLWNDILEDPTIKKVAHNAKYEFIWSFVRSFGAKVKNFHWCTMTAAHILKNKVTVGAKFLFYAHFGIINMDGEVDKYLKAKQSDVDKYGTNAINQIHVIWKKNPRAVLQYQGEDALYTAKLYELQQTMFHRRRKMKEAFEYYHEGTLALAQVQMNGIMFDNDKCQENLDFLNNKLDHLWERTLALPEAEGWNHSLTGKKLQAHLYDKLKYAVPEVDEDLAPGNRPESKAALNTIGTDFTDKIILLRKQTKIKTTIEGYWRESEDGILRPALNTHNVDTFRTSARDPNIQNPFKRDKFAKRMLREMIIPRPGSQLVGKDYKAIEVSIAGCIFPDDAWLHYCINWETSDMHRDCSAEILQMSIDAYKEFILYKVVRQIIKNAWVFPNIYGSGWKKMAANIWMRLCELPETKAILMDNHGGYEQFEKFIREYYEFYWNEKYPDYKFQRDKAHERYERVGYIDSPVGYRYYGPMSYNDFCNYPVQGSAAAIKVWAIKEINKELEANKMDSKVIYEIHDEIGGDVPPDEREEYDRIVEEIGTQRVREYWDWIITPLVLETEESKIDGDWSDMEEL